MSFVPLHCSFSDKVPKDFSARLPHGGHLFVLGGPAKAERKIALGTSQMIEENKTMAYIDGFVAAVPTQNRDAYRKHDETVVFSWIVWPSKQTRDEGMKKMMSDLRIQPDVNPMPFDGKRLIFGSFEVLVEA
jgi:hypothetical protein